MEEKLTLLAQIIEEYFDKEVWPSEPPIYETDLKLALLATKLYCIKRNITNAKDVELELVKIKLYMEKEFKIPSEEELNAWLISDEKRHKVVIDIYRQL